MIDTIDEISFHQEQCHIPTYGERDHELLYLNQTRAWPCRKVPNQKNVFSYSQCKSADLEQGSCTIAMWIFSHHFMKSCRPNYVIQRTFTAALSPLILIMVIRWDKAFFFCTSIAKQMAHYVFSDCSHAHLIKRFCEYMIKKNLKIHLFREKTRVIRNLL